MELDEIESKTVNVSADIAASLVQYMDYLIERGYYSSRDDIIRQAIIDLFIDKFEISLIDLEPDLFEFPDVDDFEEE
ncbi:MAG: hypothetical protein ACTSR2_06100 [Candidatus Hodarchaeales archaeon]